MESDKKKTLSPSEAETYKKKMQEREKDLQQKKSGLVDLEKDLAEAKSSLNSLGQQIKAAESARDSTDDMSEGENLKSLRKDRAEQSKEVKLPTAKVASCNKCLEILPKVIKSYKDVLKAPVAAPNTPKPAATKRKAPEEDSDNFEPSKRVTVGRHVNSHFGDEITETINQLALLASRMRVLRVNEVVDVSTHEEAIDTLRSLRSPRGMIIYEAKSSTAALPVTATLLPWGGFDYKKWVKPETQQHLGNKKAGCAFKDTGNENVKKTTDNAKPASNDTAKQGGKVKVDMTTLYKIPVGPQLVCRNPFCPNPVGHHLRSCVMPNKLGFVPGCPLHNESHSPHSCDGGKAMFAMMRSPAHFPKPFLAMFIFDRRRKPAFEMDDLICFAEKLPRAVKALNLWDGIEKDGIKEFGLAWTQGSLFHYDKFTKLMFTVGYGHRVA